MTKREKELILAKQVDRDLGRSYCISNQCKTCRAARLCEEVELLKQGESNIIKVIDLLLQLSPCPDEELAHLKSRRHDSIIVEGVINRNANKTL